MHHVITATNTFHNKRTVRKSFLAELISQRVILNHSKK